MKCAEPLSDTEMAAVMAEMEDTQNKIEVGFFASLFKY
jgi:hypothetical protein